MLCSVIFNFYFVHFKNSLNFPYHDEYRTISKVIIDFVKSHTIEEKIKVLFITENESLQLFLKLANISFFYAFGKIRYDLLGLVGQLSLLVFPFLIYKLNKNRENLIFALSITILIIFNLQYYVLSFRHDTAFYYYLGVLGTLMSVYFWVKQKYYLSILFFIIGIFNNSSSILILFVFFFDYVLLHRKISKKLFISISLLLILVLSLFYYINPGIFYVSQTPLTIIRKFLVIMGNYMEFLGLHNPILYIGLGALVTLLTLAIIGIYYFKNTAKTNFTRFYILSALYFFFTLIVIGIKRSMLSINDLLDPRYKFFTFSLLLFLILLSIEIFNFRKRIQYAILSIFLIYNVYYSFQSSDYIRFLFQGGKINSVALANKYDVLGPTYGDFSIKLYKEMDSLHIEPTQDPEFLKMRNFIKTTNLDSIQASNISISRENKTTSEQGSHFLVCKLNGYSPNKESFIFLKSAKNIYIFPIAFYLRNSKKNFIHTLSYTGQYFYCYLYLSLFKKGDYRLGVISKDQEGLRFKIKLDKQKLKI